MTIDSLVDVKVFAPPELIDLVRNVQRLRLGDNKSIELVNEIGKYRKRRCCRCQGTGTVSQSICDRCQGKRMEYVRRPDPA